MPSSRHQGLCRLSADCPKLAADFLRDAALHAAFHHFNAHPSTIAGHLTRILG